MAQCSPRRPPPPPERFITPPRGAPPPPTAPSDAVPLKDHLEPISLDCTKEHQLDEIKEANARNLLLAKNAHFSSAMTKRTEASNLHFDRDKAKKAIEASSPGLNADAVLEAIMGGKSPADAVAQVIQGMSPEDLQRLKTIQDVQRGQLSEDAITPSPNKLRLQDPRFDMVMHETTHSLQIQSHVRDHEDPCTREVPVIQIYREPPVMVMPDFLTGDECQHILDQCVDRWEGEPGSRCSFTAKPQLSTCIERVALRVAAATNTDPHLIATPIVAKYLEGEEFVAYLDGDTVEQTLMVFLNDVAEGGETDFPELGFQLRPHMGIGVLWRNVDENGRVDIRSAHQSLTSVGETKYVVMCFVPRIDTAVPNDDGPRG
eukprot:GHVO01017603.1.p1 GENE.GHVO01017603.1~~GHVO01017603.1.p1  ORF type:complete len:374 (-),score=93.66 GHVO01017603.1:40-1161(-)